FFTECAPYIDNPPEDKNKPQILRGEPRIPNGVLADGITLDRLRGRADLIGQFDDQLRRAEGQPALENFDPFERKALGLLTSRRVRAAFDIAKDARHLRARYGRTLFGSCTLIARKLVAEGVRFVNVTWDTFWERYKTQHWGWDTHEANFPIYKSWNLPY